MEGHAALDSVFVYDPGERFAGVISFANSGAFTRFYECS